MGENAQAARLPRLHKVKRRLSDGRVVTHHYHRVTRASLPDPNDPSFKAAYQAAEAELASRDKGTEPISQKPSDTIAGATGLSNAIMSSDPLLTPEEVVARYRGALSLGTLANLRVAKEGPPFIKIRKSVFYPLSLLLLYEKANTELCDLPKRLAETESEERVE